MSNQTEIPTKESDIVDLKTASNNSLPKIYGNQFRPLAMPMVVQFIWELRLWEKLSAYKKMS